MEKDNTKPVLINVNLIKPYWRNPRTDNNVEQIKESILKYGFNSAIILDGDNTIIVGHQRFKALKKLGYTDIPCIIKKDLTDLQVKEYRLVDNKLSELSSWDEDMLERELMDLDDVIGFESKEVEQITTELLKSDVKQAEVIHKIEEKMNHKFDDVVKDVTTVTCPHCLKEFELLL